MGLDVYESENLRLNTPRIFYYVLYITVSLDLQLAIHVRHAIKGDDFT